MDLTAPENRWRPWRWCRRLILGLLDVPPQIVVDRWPSGQHLAMRVIRVPQTRLGFALEPPDLATPDAAALPKVGDDTR